MPMRDTQSHLATETLSGTEVRALRLRLKLSQARLAELADVPQHLLSAFELEKTELPAALTGRIARSLADADAVSRISARRKRYRKHEYQAVQHRADRVEKHKPTPGNREFLAQLGELESRRSRLPGDGPSAVALFSGCGGFSLGLTWAGFDIRGAIEIDKGLREIYTANFPGTPFIGTDITAVADATLTAFAEAEGPIDVLVGGPPCQGFSLAGKRDVSDPRNTLFRHYLRVLDAMRPRVAVMENVRLLLSMKSPDGGFIRDDISREFQRHGYTVRWFGINAKDYGVPQHRERVLFVATRNDLNGQPGIPSPSFGESADMFGQLRPYRTFADACSDLPFIESGESSDDPLHAAVSHPRHVIEWLWDVPEGASAHDNADERLRPPSGYNTTYKRQVWHEPGATVQTTFGMISGCRTVHPLATRSLTIREAARLQTFPDSFRFAGSLQTVRTGIGNAVPPLLAYELGRYIRDTYF